MDLPGGALAGVRVVDGSTGLAGPLAAMLLADFGAEVVRVTPAGPDEDPGSLVWNRAKSRLAEVGDVGELVAAADVCVVSAIAPGLEGSPLHPEVACGANPRLVHLSTTPYLGDDVPWAGGEESDALVAARAGVSLRQASVGDVPVESIYPHISTVQGVWAASCAVAALVEREQSGLGQRVIVGGMNGAMVASAAAFNFDPVADEPPPGPRPGGSGGAVPFYRTYRCGDGKWLFLAALTPRFTDLAFSALGLEGLLRHERLGGRGRAAMLAPEHAPWAIETIAEVFTSAPRHEWLDRLATVGCPAGPLLDRDDWLDHPQMRAIGMRVEHPDPDRGSIVMPGNPIRLVATSRPAAPSAAAPTAPRHGTSAGSLDGVRVLDLGAIIAGPYAASLLAELGADVVKVEPLGGDSFRGPGFAAYNKGQRGIALDLRHPDGHAAFLRLVRAADVVVDNYRPGVLERLRIRHEDLVEVNPSIITLSITGFGEGGPLGGEAGFDPVLQAMSGMMTAQGGHGDPVFFTVPVNDVTAAASGAAAVCLALFARRRTGVGCRASTSLAAVSALLQAGHLVRYAGRTPASRGGTDHPGPADDDRHHRVADGWVRVRGATADPSWVTRTRASLVADLTAAGIPAVPCSTPWELVDELAAADALHHDTRPGRRHWWTIGRHAGFSRTERTGTLVAPSLGRHTREVLLEAGFDAAEVEALIASGAAGAASTGRDA